MTAAEVFAPVDSTTGVIIVLGSVGAVAFLALVARWAYEWSKRNDITIEVSTWEELAQPDWDADRPALIWVSSTLLLDWLTQYGGAAEDDAIVGVDTALPRATVRYVYADEQVIDVTVSQIVARDVAPEWSAGPLAWASDADIDGFTHGGTPLPDRRIRTRHLLADNDAPDYREVTALRYGKCAFSEGHSAVEWSFDGEFYRDRIEEGYDTDDGFVVAEPLPKRVVTETPFQRERIGIWADPNGEVTGALPHRTPGALLPAEFVTDCSDYADGEDCGGCACHRAAPCGHCVEHVREAEPDHELTAPVEHATPRERLAEVAAVHEQHHGAKPVIHAEARKYDLEGIGSVCSGCRQEWPCDGAQVNGSPL